MKRRWMLVSAVGFALAAARGSSQDNTVIPKEIRDAAQVFTEGVIIAKGIGAAPTDRPLSAAQKEALALRAAKVVALRELADTAGGIRLAGDTAIRDAAATNDQIRGTMEAFVRGADVIHESYDESREKAVVFVRLNLKGPNSMVENLLPKIIQQQAVSLAPVPAYRPPESAPPPPPAPADGLIIDATGSSFRPALINRILTAGGSALFEPSRIAPDILAKKGCGEYTNDIGKAKAILAERGAKHPLVVKVAGVQRSTDAQVSETDDAAIFTANQKANFLEGAKVVFVL